MRQREPDAQGTRRHQRLNRLAALLDKLQKFVRSSKDSELAPFLSLYAPRFFPAEPGPRAEKLPDWGSPTPNDQRRLWREARLRAVKKLRQYLEDVWRGQDASGYKLSCLLGVVTPMDIQDWPASRWLLSLRTAHAIADWTEGRFKYRPACEFQEALFFLFEASWRAKICQRPSCQRLFIAEEKAAKYCSTQCSTDAKRALEMKWWNSKGKFRRRAKLALRKGVSSHGTFEKAAH
jgi:hypothetical protein